jgi:MFS family permease
MIKDNRLFGLSLSAFLLMLGDGMVLSLLPQKTLTLTNSNLMVGYLASIYALAQVLSQIPFGILADRIGFKPFIVMGYILSSLAGFLFYLTDNTCLLFLGRILQGVGEAPILALAPAAISMECSNNKGKAIGIYNASIYLGLTAGPLFALVFLNSDNQVFLFYTITCMLGATLNSLILRNKSQRQPTKSKIIIANNLLASFNIPYILLVFCGIALYGGAQGIFMTIIPACLITEKSFEQSLIGIFFSSFNAAIALAQLITGPISDKLGRKPFMIVGLLLAATGLLLSSDFDQVGLVLILSASSLGLGIFYLSSMAFINDIFPSALKGTISGVYFLFWGIGMFCGPIVAAKYAEFRGYNSGICILVTLLVLQAIFLLVFSKKTGRNIPCNKM